MKSHKKPHNKKKTHKKRRTQRAGASITSNYTPTILVMKNTDELIQISRTLRDIFMGDSADKKSVINKKGNFWIRKKVTDKMPQWFGCLGQDTSNYVEVDEDLIIRSIKLVSKLFRAHGLFVENELYIDTDTNIEVHLAKADKKELGSNFVVHEDNNGGIRGRLHTCIVYLDIQCEGGQLEVYDNAGDILTQTIDPKIDPESGSVNETKVVVFNGGMMHCPTSIKNGTRLIVTYQLRQRGDRDREDSEDEDSDEDEDSKKSGGSGFKSKSSKSYSSKSKSCIPFQGNVLKYGKHHGIA